MKKYIPNIETIEEIYYAIQLIKKDGMIRYFGSDDFTYNFNKSFKRADLYAVTSLYSLSQLPQNKFSWLAF